MALSEQINNDLKVAMKEKDSFTLGVIRMLKGAMQLAKTNVHDEMTDEEVIDVVSKQIKLRKDSINEFKKANREDLVSQNEQEITVLAKYLPEQLSSEAILEIIEEAFAKVNPTSAKDMGLIMKEVTPKVKGKADMGEVSKIIKDKLTSING
jgi:hypothetical protein